MFQAAAKRDLPKQVPSFDKGGKLAVVFYFFSLLATSTKDAKDKPNREKVAPPSGTLGFTCSRLPMVMLSNAKISP